MPFTIKDFHDLVTLLEEHPEWRAELRRLLLSEELLELPAYVRRLIEAQTRTEERFQAIAEQIESLTRRLEEFQIRTEARFQVVAEQIESLTRRLEEFQIRTEERFQTVAEQMEALTRRVDALAERVDALAEQMEVLTRRVDALAEQMEALTRRVDALAEQMEILTRRVDALAERVDALAEQMEVLTRRVDALAEQMEALTRRVDALAEQMEALTRRVDALAEQVNTLVGQVASLAMRIDTLGQQLSQLIEWQRGEDGRRRGERYERDIVRRAVTIFAGGAGGTAEDFRVQEKLGKWIRAITGGERFLEPEEDPALSDLIWWKGEKVLVVEASLRVDGYDVMRAHKRAEILRSIGVDAVPVVIGIEWASDEAYELAERKGVWWYVNETPSEELVEFRLMEG